jgi:hypothetical protein
MSTKSYVYSLTAVLIWSILAILGSKVVSVPSFLLVGVALLTSGTLTISKIRKWKVTKKTLIGGILKMSTAVSEYT